MADLDRHTDGGAWVITLCALAGLAVALYNYYASDNGISGTSGALLVVGSTLAILFAGFVLGRDVGGTVLRTLLALLALFAILGTALAAWLLESQVLLGLMGLCLVGWVLRLFQREPAYG